MNLDLNIPHISPKFLKQKLDWHHSNTEVQTDKEQHTTLGLALLGHDVVIFNCSNMAAVVRAWPNSIWLFVVIFIISFSIGLQFRADVFQIPQQRQALPVVRNPKTNILHTDSNTTFSAKFPTTHRTLQHICKAHKTPTQKPTLQKSCNCQHTANIL